MTRLGGSDRCPPPWREGAPAVLEELTALLDDFQFRPGWSFHLMTYGHETVLGVEIETVDTYHPESGPGLIGHKFPVPVLPLPRREWRAWLLDRIADVDRHEACEWFRERVVGVVVPAGAELTEGVLSEQWVRPFDPHRDPGQSAYRVRDWLGDG
jgi:hypothetical protein